VKTYGFGGGTNAAANSIPPGGFDSLVALFSGMPAAASILMSGGNPVGSQAGGTQFFAGCGPAGMVMIGSESVCGDNHLTASLAPGTYTLLLSDANFVPFAFSPGDSSPYNLTDTSANTYADLAAGFSPGFQTCNDQGDCIPTNGKFAVDILGLPAPSAQVPEPCTLALVGFGLAGLIYKRRRGQGSVL
jgi:hypothetical protein